MVIQQALHQRPALKNRRLEVNRRHHIIILMLLIAGDVYTFIIISVTINMLHIITCDVKCLLAVEQSADIYLYYLAYILHGLVICKC